VKAFSERGRGLTPSERYLKRLCEKTFLSLWSFPNLFKGPGDELCDMLVVYENDVIIFSDKSCAFPDTGSLELDWLWPPRGGPTGEGPLLQLGGPATPSPACSSAPDARPRWS
jgi:hypothetical protein